MGGATPGRGGGSRVYKKARRKKAVSSRNESNYQLNALSSWGLILQKIKKTMASKLNQWGIVYHKRAYHNGDAKMLTHLKRTSIRSPELLLERQHLLSATQMSPSIHMVSLGGLREGPVSPLRLIRPCYPWSPHGSAYWSVGNTATVLMFCQINHSGKSMNAFLEMS